MRFDHPAITSPLFELVRTLEVDLRLGEDHVPLRIELFGDLADATRFRCHVWEREFFRLTPTFPQDDAGEPKDVSDDELLVERSTQLRGDYDDFTAPDADAALKRVMEDLAERLEHWTGGKATLTGGTG